MTAIRRLAAFVADAERPEPPAAHRHAAKRALLDTIGCMMLGAGAEDTRAALRTADAWGAGRAPVYGASARLSPPWAAFVNGVSAHAFDMDDYTLVANDHPSAVMAPALLAQAAGDPTISGAALLDAYLTGLEVVFRLGAALNMGHYNLGWHTTATIDSFGATAAVARLTGLDADRAAMALALTPSLGTGYNSQFGTSAKPIHAGWSAKTGVVAASLAAAGATGHDGALDGPVSFASLMTPDGSARFDDALDDLGERWGLDSFGIGAKLYPSCGYTHRAIDGAREIYEQFGPIGAGDLAAARICLPTHHLAILPFAVPDTQNEALFSPAWCAAAALATGGCGGADFLPDALAQPERRALAGAIEVKARAPKRPEINVDPDDPDIVEVELRDGRGGRAVVPRWRGAPGRELSDAELIGKFQDMCGLGGLRRAEARAIETEVWRLERAPNLEALTAALAAASQSHSP